MKHVTRLLIAAALVCGAATALEAGPIYGLVYHVQVSFAAANTVDDEKHYGSTEPYEFDPITFTGDFGPYALGTTPERIVGSTTLIAPNTYMSWNPDSVSVQRSRLADGSQSGFAFMAWMFDPFSDDVGRSALLLPGTYEAVWVDREIYSENLSLGSVQYSGATITISSPEVVEIPPAPLPEPSAMSLIPLAIGGGYLVRRIRSRGWSLMRMCPAFTNPTRA